MSERERQAGTFVQGLLIEKQCDYDSFYHLTFLLRSSILLPVFSSASRLIGSQGKLGAQLQVGRNYHLLLLIRPRQLKYRRPEEHAGAGAASKPGLAALALRQIARDARGVSGERVILQHHPVSGRIVDPDWEWERQRYILVETAVGRAVLNRKAAEDDLKGRGGELAAGGLLEWELWRSELLALLDGVGGPA
ncbi:hypothetical protein [Thermogemmatispora tikiterensis]|uniref:Uncharacterized protein n=1 Tax=Thermogemmatispora tikiterensis TaxID=1825093 RepID=A0A328VF71_9CHLR|nr:hypothetical protein [Thermogemmatispora tikiterensis]RAQ94692.1 hypothetical protein A4R35_04035 [Thermogemmatispora tikiterensis]